MVLGNDAAYAAPGADKVQNTKVLWESKKPIMCADTTASRCGLTFTVALKSQSYERILVISVVKNPRVQKITSCEIWRTTMSFWKWISNMMSDL